MKPAASRAGREAGANTSPATGKRTASAPAAGTVQKVTPEQPRTATNKRKEHVSEATASHDEDSGGEGLNDNSAAGGDGDGISPQKRARLEMENSSVDDSDTE